MPRIRRRIGTGWINGHQSAMPAVKNDACSSACTSSESIAASYSAGTCHAAAYRRIRLVSPDADLPDRNAADVRDCIPWSGLQIADPQAKVAQTLH